MQTSPSQTPGQCVHTWIIGAARGPVSVGVCRKCGAEKDFSNSIGNTFLKQIAMERNEIPRMDYRLIYGGKLTT